MDRALILAQIRKASEKTASIVSEHWLAHKDDPEAVKLMHAVLNQHSVIAFRLDALERELEQESK